MKDQKLCWKSSLHKLEGTRVGRSAIRWLDSVQDLNCSCSEILDKLIEFPLVVAILRNFWSLKVNYDVHNSLPLVSGLSHTNPALIVPYDFCQTYFFHVCLGFLPKMCVQFSPTYFRCLQLIILNTHSLHFPPNMMSEFHTYTKGQAKLQFLCILIFTFLGTGR